MVYKEKDSDATPNSWAVEGNTSHSVQLTGLGKYVLYEIQVLAFTRIGDGRSSSPTILERTLDDGGSPSSGIISLNELPHPMESFLDLFWMHLLDHLLKGPSVLFRKEKKNLEGDWTKWSSRHLSGHMGVTVGLKTLTKARVKLKHAVCRKTIP